jgi:predicted acyl esterase
VDFRTGPIERDLRIAGAPQVPVTAIPTGEGGRIGALLLDQGPEGEPVILSYGFIDLRFAEGGDAMKPVVPGQPVVAKLELLPMDVVLKPGHELVLRVTTDVMGELGPFSVLVVDTPTPLNSFPVILQVGGDSSLLKLPVIERTPEQLAGGWPFGPAPE